MDQRIRLIAAAAVLLAGMGLALCFRRVPGETTLTIPTQDDALAASTQAGSRSVAADARPATVYPAPRPRPAAVREPRRLLPTVVASSDQPTPPPKLPKSYPGDPRAGTPTGTAAQQWSAYRAAAGPRWGPSTAEMLPDAASACPTHRIVDGDTLPALAERYLGSTSRANEIYEANRSVLTDPSILRIGMELKIPRSDQAAR